MSELALRPWHLAMGALAAGLAAAPAPRALALVALAAAAAAGLAARSPRLVLLTTGLVLVGIGIGDARVASMERPATRLHGVSELRADALALERARPGPFGWSLALELRSGPGAGARLLGRFPRSLSAAARVEPGSILTVRGELTQVRGNGGFERYLRSRGIAGALDADSARSPAVGEGDCAAGSIASAGAPSGVSRPDFGRPTPRSFAEWCLARMRRSARRYAETGAAPGLRICLRSAARTCCSWPRSRCRYWPSPGSECGCATAPSSH